MANEVYRIKQCGALALTKDGLLFVSLQINQWLCFHKSPFRRSSCALLPPLSPSALVVWRSCRYCGARMAWLMHPCAVVDVSSFKVYYLIPVQSWRAIPVIIEHPVTSSQTVKVVSINLLWLCTRGIKTSPINCQLPVRHIAHQLLMSLCELRATRSQLAALRGAEAARDFAQARAVRSRCTCLSPHRRSSRSQSHRRRGAGGGPSARCLLLACCLLSLLTCRLFFIAHERTPKNDQRIGSCGHMGAWGRQDLLHAGVLN
jgi:hypothetical protein